MSLVQTGVCLIPLFLLATVAGVFLLARYWYNQTQQDLKILRSEIRRLQGERRQIIQAMQGHSPQDPEPYGSRVSELQTQLEAIDDQIRLLEYQHVDLQERVRALTLNRWQALMGAPYFWYMLHKDVGVLREVIDEAKDALSAANEYEQSLAGIAGEVAQQARQVQQKMQQAGSSLEKLASCGVHGQAVEAANQQRQQFDQALAAIPEPFFNAAQDELLEQVSKEEVAQAHQTLADIQPQLESLLSQTRDWEKLYLHAIDRVEIMRRVVEEAGKTLTGMPTGLALTEVKNQFKQLETVAQNLIAVLPRLEAESMGAVSGEAERLAHRMHEIETTLRQARRQFSLLDGLLTSLGEELKALSLLLATLGTHATRPVLWGQASAALAELNRQLSAIGPANKTRTPEQIEADLAAARQISEQRKALAEHCQRVANQHAEMMRILESPEFGYLPEWLPNVQAVARQVQEYAAENWSRMDAVASLSEELDLIAQSTQRLVTGKRPDPIEENALPPRLEETLRLAAAYEKLSRRIEAIQGRLVEIQQNEKVAVEQVNNALRAIQQVALVVRSNPYLTEFAANDVGRFQQDLQTMQADFTARRSGSIDKKVKQAGSLLAKVELAANGWLDRLNKDIEAEVQELGEFLAILDGIAPLEEAVMVEARRLAGQAQAFGIGGYANKSKYRLDELPPEFKRRSDYWQSCDASLNKLEDLGNQVVESHNQSSEQRQIAQHLLAEASAWMSQARVWPPTSVNLETEHHEFEKLESQWKSGQNRPVKAINLVAQLGTLAGRYQALGERTRRILERASQEQKQVESLERELEDLAQMWQTQLHAYRDYPAAARDIDSLLGKLDREWDTIRQQYQRGSRDYNQTLQALKALQQKVRYFQADLDGDHAIKVNGQVIGRR